MRFKHNTILGLSLQITGHVLTLTPDETIQLNGADTLLKLGHVGFIIPGLDVQQNRRLGDEGRLCSDNEVNKNGEDIDHTI